MKEQCIFLDGNRCSFSNVMTEMNKNPRDAVISLTGNPEPYPLHIIEIGVAMSNPANAPTRRRGNGLCKDVKNLTGQKACRTYVEKGE